MPHQKKPPKLTPTFPLQAKEAEHRSCVQHRANQNSFRPGDDLVVREIETATSLLLKWHFLIDGLVDDLTVTESVLTPLLHRRPTVVARNIPCNFFETAKKLFYVRDR